MGLPQMSKMDIPFSLIFAYPIWQTFFFIKEGQMGLLDSKTNTKF